MREAPETPLGPWKPPPYEVDARGKVVGAKPGTPNNWGRWGEDDQRGTANLLDRRVIRESAALVRQGKSFSLALAIGDQQIGLRPRPIHVVTQSSADEILGDGPSLQWSDDMIVMGLQATTQLDGLAHVGHEDCLYNGYWGGAVTARSGARRLGIHHLGHGLAGRAVLLDVARHLRVPYLERGSLIGPDLLDEVASAQGVELRPADMLLVRTGWVDWRLGPGAEAPVEQGGISVACLQWLADHDVSLLATDNLAVETIPSPEAHGLPELALHIGALRDLGLPLGELWDLTPLADDCLADSVYECFLVVAPLPVVNAIGSPVNPIAFK